MTDALCPIPAESQESISMRLRRIEGQIRGIQRMVESGRDCREIVNQVVAVKAALSSLNAVVLECYVRRCLDNPDCAQDNTAEELIDMMLKASR
ncbi:MAG: metal-sensitive transcriptional regulator [Chloroflexaceae bacterium]|nr:metal-sensitive transcriptional regulator [Chloroflexaceae bacterium]NJO04233.1 metal-sensitive transcriptional regulator [Chloroflexaceae bacterium]NJO83473.1 metal-sensitive transcriptional regulator [Blastochloris sp.]